MKLIKLILFCLIFNTGTPYIQKPYEYISEITPEIIAHRVSSYRGYGSKMVKFLEKEGLHPYEICIVMTETGGVIPKGFNFGNLRNKDLTYRVYSTKEEGLNAFKSLIRKKYKKHFTSLPQQTFENMQPIYAPDGKVWDNRCMYWYTKIYQP